MSRGEPVRPEGQEPSSEQRRILDLQRAAGNRAVTEALERAPRPGEDGRPALGLDLPPRAPKLGLQRHAVGTELPDKGQQLAEINAKAVPAASRSIAEKKTQTGEATAAGASFVEAQKLTPGAMSLASAEKILQGSYGGMKRIVPGTIVVLADQPACSRKYDEVCIADGLKRPDGSAWQMGDCAKDDAAAGVRTEGFEWKGTVYVNGATTLVTATAHEVLHSNTGPGFRSKCGETFNEGMTEFLARKALSASGIPVPGVTAYPEQVKLTTKLIDLLGESTMMDAYFSGPDAMISSYESLKGTGSWAKLKGHAEKLETAEAEKAMSTSIFSWATKNIRSGLHWLGGKT